MYHKVFLLLLLTVLLSFKQIKTIPYINVNLKKLSNKSNKKKKKNSKGKSVDALQSLSIVFENNVIIKNKQKNGPKKYIYIYVCALKFIEL